MIGNGLDSLAHSNSNWYNPYTVIIRLNTFSVLPNPNCNGRLVVSNTLCVRVYVMIEVIGVGRLREYFFIFAIIISIFFCFQFSMVSVYFILFQSFPSIARSLFLAAQSSGIECLQKINTCKSGLFALCIAIDFIYHFSFAMQFCAYLDL